MAFSQGESRGQLASEEPAELPCGKTEQGTAEPMPAVVGAVRHTEPRVLATEPACVSFQGSLYL